ncbi:MAG: amino acid adenylation domain-containing protein [Candidatus Sulfotelmatobacter sp.]
MGIKAEEVSVMPATEQQKLLTRVLSDRVGPIRTCPLSFAQERLWFLEQMQPGNVAYNLPVMVRLEESVDRDLLERALHRIVERHEALRTTFAMVGGRPVQRIAPRLEIPVEEVNLAGAEGSAREAQCIVNEEMKRAFDLQHGPLLRAKLLRQGAGGGTVLLLHMHHIVSDGWSLGVLERELKEAYASLQEGREPAWEALRIQYADYAVWQHEWLQGERLEEELKYWGERLRGAPALLELPAHPRPAVESYRGAMQTFGVPAKVVAGLRELARERKATLFMVLLAVYQALLARYSGQRDIVVGTPIANRNRSELEPLIGFFVNMLGLRTDVQDEWSIVELVDRVREVTLGGYEHQDLPFEKLVEELGVARSLSHSPVYQAVLVLQNTPQDEGQRKAESPLEIAGPNWKECPESIQGTSKFDVTMYLEERGDGLVGSCEYRTDLFDAGTISRMIQRYVGMLAAAGADNQTRVRELPLVLKEEPEVERRSAPQAEPWLLERMKALGNGEWKKEVLAVNGTAAAELMGLDESSRLVVLGKGKEEVKLLGQVAAAATGATLEPLEGKEEEEIGEKNSTHILLTAEELAGLSPKDIDEDTVMVVIGLPWFAASLARWQDRHVVGIWGVREALCCAALRMEEREAVIEKPVPGCWIEVLDERKRRQGIDLWGEIYVGGAAVRVRGRNKEKRGKEGDEWIEDPYDPGARLYHTGLVGRRRVDGRIEVAGTAAEMVQIDGMRVDPSRLENVLRQHPGVKAAAVKVPEEGERETRLLAWVVQRDEMQDEEAVRQVGRANEDGLMSYVGECLTAGLIPRRIAIVRQLPDRKESWHAETEEKPQEPRTAVEAVIARIWSEVLKQPQRDVNANFFDLWGNSLTSVQVISRIRDTLHVELPLHRLFEFPTIAALADLVQKEQAEMVESWAGDRASNTTVEAAAESDAMRMSRIRRAPPGPRRLRAPLSYAQDRLWFLDQFEPSSTLYNMSIVVPLEASADITAVHRVLTEICRRHESLRTTFPAIAGSPQQVIDAARPVPMPVSNLTAIPPQEVDAEVARITTHEANQPFDLSRGPLLRARFVRTAANCYLSLVVHHIVFDGWSFGILMREFWILYRAFKENKPSPLEELPVQYADFARWQRRCLSGKRFETHMEYWRCQLAGFPEALNLPTDRPRPAIETHKGATQWFSIPGTTVAASCALARRQNTTLFCVLLAAFKTLLMRLSGQEDIIVGSPVANRTQVEVEGLIGFFVNTLALRTDLTGNPTFLELIEGVHRTNVAASEHQELPFEKIVQELQPRRTLNHSPIFQVMLVLQNMPEGQGSLREYAETWQHSQLLNSESVTPGSSKFDVTLTLIETRSGMIGALEYSTDLFDDATISRMARQFTFLLEAATSTPDARLWELRLMNLEEEADLVRALTGPITKRVVQTVRDLFEIQVDRTPFAPAVISGDMVLTYNRLNAASNRLALHLMRLGVSASDRVAISLPRGPVMLIAVLAVLKAGAAYVPVDPAYPEPRRTFMLSDSRASLLICNSASRPEVPGGLHVLQLDSDVAIASAKSEDNPAAPLTFDSPAYVIYTSGSTGLPKGVVMRHGALSNLINWQVHQPDFLNAARTLQFTSLSFDVSFQELFSTWSTGGALVQIDEEMRTDPALLLRSLFQYRIQRLFMPYVALQQLAEAARDTDIPLPPLQEVITAGEQLQITPAISELFKRLKNCSLRNQYGPTETHVATEYVLSEYRANWPTLPPIGRPIANASVRILDRFMNTVPVGVVGEIYLAGDCLALGYLDRPAQTAERFLPDKWGNAGSVRMYRTGDLGKVRADWNIEFLGRADHQIKIRGYRIEPGEIELTLSQMLEVEEAVVVVLGELAESKRLAAFVKKHSSADADSDCIREFLARRLPEYMVPSLIVIVRKFPLTPSGKIDRRALMQTTFVPRNVSESFEPCSTPLERMLAEHWSELLGIDRVGIEDDFFQLGGHSLLATRVTARIRSAIGLELPVRSVFEAPTVRQLARRIAEDVAERVTSCQSDALLTKLSDYMPEIEHIEAAQVAG